MEIYIFLGLVGAARLVTAWALLRLAARNHLPNLRWLAWGFISTVIALPFTADPYYPFIDKFIAYFTYLCFARFISQTFYNKNSPFPVFWAVFTVLHLSMFWFADRFMTATTGLVFPQYLFAARPDYTAVPMERYESIDSVIYGILQMAIWIWHAMAGVKGARSVAHDELVEDWVKSRYRWIITYSLLQSLIGLVLMLRPFVPPAVVILSALLVLATTSMQYLVWVMPAWFYKWLNRNQAARMRERIHEQAVAALDIIGSAMADGTGLQKMLALFTLRKGIGVMIHSEDAERIEAYAASMDYQQWLSLLRMPDFQTMVRNSSGGADANTVIKQAESALMNKQSLFTMQAR